MQCHQGKTLGDNIGRKSPLFSSQSDLVTMVTLQHDFWYDGCAVMRKIIKKNKSSVQL